MSLSNSYFRVRLKNVPSQLEDLVTGVCFEFGADGVTESLRYSQPDLTYDPDVLPQSTHDLDVFFQAAPTSDFFESLRKLSSHISHEVFEEENKDWLAEWKKGFNPFRLVGDYWVVPSWHESPTDNSHTISIDPGMAFGTGTHATTQMAAYFVNKWCSTANGLESKSFVDVGTGTAILAMLAGHQGIGRILGIEIDPEARRVARENIARNNLTKIEISDELIEEVDEQFDLVVANIIDGVLIQIKDALLQAMKPHGDLFVTGILLEREDIFLENFIEVSGLQIHRRIERDEWVGYWLKS